MSNTTQRAGQKTSGKIVFYFFLSLIIIRYLLAVIGAKDFADLVFVPVYCLFFGLYFGAKHPTEFTLKKLQFWKKNK